MGSELVFTVTDGVPKVATPRKLADAGLKERQDIEEWVIANPRLIGSDVLIITSEFAGWTSTKGAKSLDRLDILGLAEDGRLVVAELKRGDAPSTVEMQVLNYAARASLFKVDELVRVYQHFRESRGELISEDAARAALQAHAAELSDDSLDYTPRVVVLAEDFGPDVTTTAHFLAGKLSLDIELIQLDAYETVSGELVISSSTRYPPPDISQEFFTRMSSRRRRRTWRRHGRRTRCIDSSQPMPSPRGRSCASCQVPRSRKRTETPSMRGSVRTMSSASPRGVTRRQPHSCGSKTARPTAPQVS